MIVPVQPQSRPDVLRDQIPQPGALRQRHHPHQARVRHQIRVVEGCASWPGYATIALDGCPFELGDGSFRHSHRPSSEGTFHVDTPLNTPN